MKLLKPSWISHDGHPIFSIDIHPDGTRFATGGQGHDSAGRIVIWNLKPVLQFEAAADVRNGGNGVNSDIPKILCQLDHHNACVNCVRWSHSGQYLASGGDDKAIMIWKLVAKQRPNSSISVGNAFGKPNYETWKSITELRSHKGDILHLAWSPDDKYLASASVDNKVIVWDANQFPQIIYELAGHSSMCKGVTWDPVGKYVATQSDDKSLKIWRTSDWQVEQCITDPFIECGGTTHVLRLDWSPDGLYLVSAHAMNSGGPTAQIIERDGWKTDKGKSISLTTLPKSNAVCWLDFVGHRKAVTCVRFNQNILEQDKSRYCYVALGSRDRSISVWSTSLKRPVIVVNDLFTNSVMDLSWSCCGKILMACSWDGTAAVARFKNSEIGKSLTNEDKAVLHHRFYGTKAALASSEVVQNLEVFLTLKKDEKKMDVPVSNNQSIKQSPETTPESETHEPVIRGPIDKQIETRTSDGKRRITPKFLLPCPSDITTDVLKSDESNSNQFGALKDSEKKDPVSFRDKMISNISEVKIPEIESTHNHIVDKPVENTEVHKKDEEPKSTPNEANLPETQQHSDDPTLTTKSELKSSPVEVGRTENDSTKKESQGEEMSQEEDMEEENDVRDEANENNVNETTKKRRLSEDDKLPPTVVVPKKAKLQPATPTPSTSATSSLPTSSNTSPGKPYSSGLKDDRANKVTTTAVLPTATPLSQPPTINLVNGHSPSAPSTASPPKPVISSVRARLPPMKIDSALSRRIQSKKEINYTLEINNKPSITGSHLLTCQHDTTSLNGLTWNIWMAYPICGISGDLFRVIALCEDNTVHTFDIKGRYAVPPMMLNSFPSKMFQLGCHLLIITVKATLHLWNIHTKKNIIKSESIAPLLDQKHSNEIIRAEPVEVIHANISSLGSPILILSNGKSFHFNMEMKAWMQYSDPGTSYSQQFAEARQAYSKQFLSNLQLRNLRQSEPYAVTQVKLKLASAVELQLNDGIHTCLIALAKTLATYDLTSELHQLCEDLLGPAHSSAKLSTSWNPKIFGVDKRKVLRGILKILVQDLQWQDLYCEFNDLLASVEGSATAESALDI